MLYCGSATSWLVICLDAAKADGVDTGVEMLPEPAEDLRHRGFRGAPMPPEVGVEEIGR